MHAITKHSYMHCVLTTSIVYLIFYYFDVQVPNKSWFKRDSRLRFCILILSLMSIFPLPNPHQPLVSLLHVHPCISAHWLYYTGLLITPNKILCYTTHWLYYTGLLITPNTTHWLYYRSTIQRGVIRAVGIVIVQSSGYTQIQWSAQTTCSRQSHARQWRRYQRY